ncbi:MAG: hypothetical protein HQL55_17460, partial [Magnetococcales bacterium]|nr:hypothetical protein [Magnetococcales bacterium]
MFKLLRYFSLTSLVAMLLVALMLGFFFRQVEMQNLLRLGEGQNVALTKVFTNSLWPILNSYIRQSNELQFHAIRENPVVPLLDHTVRHLISDLEVTKVKIYNRRGVTIYSTDAKQIGEEQGQNVGVQSALKGQVISNMVHRQGPPSFDGVVEEMDLISSYVPLKRGEDILGVLELYYDISPLLAQIHQN